LASGWAEWDFELEGRGPVRACAEVKMGLVHVSLFLDRCDAAVVGVRALELPRASGRTKRIRAPRRSARWGWSAPRNEP
jgi:hypothetical protein